MHRTEGKSVSRRQRSTLLKDLNKRASFFATTIFFYNIKSTHKKQTLGNIIEHTQSYFLRAEIARLLVKLKRDKMRDENMLNA